jgi:hypothetical protein
MLLAHATMGRADGGIDQQFDPGGFGGISNIFALSDLAIETDGWKPEILHAENAIDSPEGVGELIPIVHIAGHDLRAQGGQCLCGRFAGVTREGAHLPTFHQKLPRDCTTLLPGCTGYCNDFVIHIFCLSTFNILNTNWYLLNKKGKFAF